jgi:hypothetical protein
MDELTITRWPSLMDPHGERYTMTWARLAKLLTTRRTFDGDKKHSGWSPATFAGDRRALERVESVQALCLDYDAGEPLDEILARFPGISLVLHTTRKHTPEAPRCRVVIEVSRPMSGEEFSRLWRRISPKAGGLDAAPKDPSRFWFTPGCPRESEFVGTIIQGKPLNVDEWLSKPDPVTPPPRPEKRDDAPLAERARQYVAKMPSAISGQGGHQSTWHVALVLAKGFGLNESQTLDVLREYNQRCDPPWTERELAHKAKGAQSANVPHGFVLDRDRPWSPTARRAIESAIGPDQAWVDDLAEREERSAIQEEGAGSPAVAPQDEPTRLHFEDDLFRLAALRATASAEPERIMTTGHAVIDEQTGGYEKEFCWVIGADTSWGKTSHSIMTYELNAELGFRPLIVTLEDSEKLYGSRFLARRTGINPVHLKRVRKGLAVFTSEEVDKISRAVRDTTHKPIILDARGRPIEWIAKRIKAIVRDQGIDMVMVDYLQAAENERPQKDRRSQLTYIARTVTDAIKTAGAAGILYSQITVSDTKKTPDRHSLKESRDIGNAAETVALGFIAESDIPRKTDDTIKAGSKVLFVDKVKDGPPRQIHKMNWAEDLACFFPVGGEERKRPARPGYSMNFNNEFDGGIFDDLTAPMSPPHWNDQ